MVTDFGCNLNNRGGPVGVNQVTIKNEANPSRKIEGINDVANFTSVLSKMLNRGTPAKMES